MSYTKLCEPYFEYGTPRLLLGITNTWHALYNIVFLLQRLILRIPETDSMNRQLPPARRTLPSYLIKITCAIKHRRNSG